jgi:hypothetical protein
MRKSSHRTQTARKAQQGDFNVAMKKPTNSRTCTS